MRLAQTTFILTLMLAATACTVEKPDLNTAEHAVEPFQCDPEEGLILFEQQIAPLMATEGPASCEKCHMTGTKLDQFINGTPCEAMGCMIEQGLVDLKAPDESLVLDWISRGVSGEDTPTGRAAHREFEAFSEWIRHSSACHVETCGAIDDPCGTGLEEEVVCATDDHGACGADLDRREAITISDLDCSERDVATAFHVLVSPWRNRCAHCHAPSGSLSDLEDPEFGKAPTWMDDAADEDGSLRTMHNIINAGYIDLDRPGQSSLLLKPLWESQGGTLHGGGDKFRGPSDQSYRDFLVWIVKYSRCAPLELDPELIR